MWVVYCDYFSTDKHENVIKQIVASVMAISLVTALLRPGWMRRKSSQVLALEVWKRGNEWFKRKTKEIQIHELSCVMCFGFVCNIQMNILIGLSVYFMKFDSFPQFMCFKTPIPVPLSQLKWLWSRVCLRTLYPALINSSIFLIKVVCIGSIDELEQMSGVRATDLHREKYEVFFSIIGGVLL